MASKSFKSILKSLKNFAIACFFGWLIFSPVLGENNNQPHWNASESFPKTPANMLGIVDLFDVPFGEKPIIENSIKNNVQIGSPVIIINNQETGNV